ncbi:MULTISPECIES: GAF domain-containing protein [Ramlibacter]|uniref:GAF domain-containing protein n=1 Tax=Ramlibacter aquaticus TaxID=2780094 RepID=A0ABR9SFG6_9BURK|nr:MULTISPECIES: GAF domain-containing protein [Ramlibacter]MBE7941095.1 GAF domain-containing protein [Ramlibacter aquaticus]
MTPSLDPQPGPDRARQVEEAVDAFAAATSGDATHDLFQPLTFLLAQVRQSLGMDVVFVSRFVDQARVFEVVSAEGPLAQRLAPGQADPLVDTYCQRVVDGRLPRLIPDAAASPESVALAITRVLNIGAYLSAPVVLANGQVFGTVCCISHRSRPDLREEDARALSEVARAVAGCVERGGTLRFGSWTGSAR